MRADADFFCLRTEQIVENNGVSNDGYFSFYFNLFLSFSKQCLLLSSKNSKKKKRKNKMKHISSGYTYF